MLGTWPDYTVYVEDGYGDGDYNDNILTVHFTPPTCPPSGDSVLDDPVARRQFRDALLASNPNAPPGSGQKQEHGGVVWERSDGTFLLQDIPDPNANECTWHLPPGTPTPPEPGLVAKATWHTHAYKTQQPVYGCQPSSQWSQTPGDHKPVPKLDPNANGGGSLEDWMAADATADMYIINNGGKLWKLISHTPPPQRMFNNNHWNWQKPSSPGCFTP